MFRVGRTPINSLELTYEAGLKSFAFVQAKIHVSIKFFFFRNISKEMIVESSDMNQMNHN